MSKGQLSLQFNWIFVLIAGGVIIFFFIMLINNQQESASNKEASELIQSIDTLFTTLSNEPNAVQQFPIPNTDIAFTCEEGLWQYYIQGAGPVDTHYDIIFTQESLKGNEVTTWTMSYDVPFRAATFTLMANDRTLFVFIDSQNSPYNHEAIKALYDELPDVFNKIMMTGAPQANGYRPDGYDRLVYIIAVSERGDLVNLGPDAVIRAVPNDYELSGHGTLYLDEQTAPYLLTPSIWGAIFSEDKDFYECTMQKAYERFIIGASILQKRSESLQDELSGTTCEWFLSQTATKLASSIDAATTQDVATMYTNKKELERIASDSLRGYACPYLY